MNESLHTQETPDTRCAAWPRPAPRQLSQQSATKYNPETPFFSFFLFLNETPEESRGYWSLFTMDEAFLKSALKRQGSFVLDDTSLALPTKPTSKPSGKVNSNERSLRVHQQVQLTLARKARKTLPNGIHLSLLTYCYYLATVSQ